MNKIGVFSKLALLLALALASSTIAVADTVGSTPSNPPVISTSGSSGLDPLFSFTFAIGSDTGSGSLSATDLGGGQFLATSGTLTVTGGADAGTYTLLAGGPGATTSPSGAFLFNDVIYPSSDPTLDVDGLLFTGGGLEINIFGNGPGSYSFDSWNGSYNVQDIGSGPVTFTQTPEPSTLALLAAGMFGLVGAFGHKKVLLA